MKNKSAREGDVIKFETTKGDIITSPVFLLDDDRNMYLIRHRGKMCLIDRPGVSVIRTYGLRRFFIMLRVRLWFYFKIGRRWPGTFFAILFYPVLEALRFYIRYIDILFPVLITGLLVYGHFKHPAIFTWEIVFRAAAELIAIFFLAKFFGHLFANLAKRQRRK